MKKVLTTIGAIIGFLGLATFTLFFIMSPQSFALPSGTGLTADISANFFGNNNAPAPAQADAPTPAPAATTPQDPQPQPQSQAEISAPVQTTTPAIATQPVIAQTPAPAATPAPESNTNNVTVPELPVATATITVSPTAPTAPPTRSQTIPATSASSTRSLPFDESNFADLADWETTWGTLEATTAGYLHLSAGVNSFGGAAYLKSGTGWANYSMHATLDPIAGKTFGLAADFTDASNYVLCEYIVTGPDTVTMQLSQYVKGYKTALTPAAPAAWSGYGADVDAGISVNGAYGTCSLGSASVSSEGIGPGKVAMNGSGSGSVGFGVNDPTPNTAQVVVKRISVVAK